MGTLTIRLPNSLHEAVRELARRDNVSINQFIALALAEKVSAMMTLEVEHLAERGRRGNRADFESVLSKVPDVEPEEYDRL